MGNKSENMLKDFHIPNYILVPGSDNQNASHIPASPVLVFINSKSGGQLGGELLITYQTLLNKNQVLCQPIAILILCTEPPLISSVD